MRAYHVVAVRASRREQSTAAVLTLVRTHCRAPTTGARVGDDVYRV